MTLLTKDGILASVGGALKKYVAGCIDSCCQKWYCHLPNYTCDKNEADHISEHSSESACLQACGEGVEHYCHVGGECDTDPTDAVATYPSKKDCDDACGQWWCCYESTDYTKGSSCQEGPCDQPDLIRGGPFESKEECEPDCALPYYCVLADGTDGSQPDHYMCVIDPAGMLVLAGPQSEAECDATCSTRRPSYWCVDEKKCVLSYDGPPVECSFGAFCEEYDDFIACGQECLKEQWYCITETKECMQLQTPPTPDATPYGSEAACMEECQAYYCCWVSQGDPTKGSYCQLGECDEGFERSGPHEDEGICETDCNKIYCWSYYDTATGQIVKTCQEDSPDGCEPTYGCEGSEEIEGDEDSLNLMISYRSDGFEAGRENLGGDLWRVYFRCQRETAECAADGAKVCSGPLLPDTCAHENVTKVSGPYGMVTECERICNPPVYKWFCENDVCVKCCQSGTCAPADRSCPASGNFSTEEDCKGSCGSPCYFCEDGVVTEDHLPPDECTGLGGFLDKTDADEACEPPPVQCYCICVSEPAPGRCDAPGAYKSCQPVFYIDSLPEDERPEIVSGPFACDDCVAECIQPPPPPCEGQKQCGDWQANYDDEGNFLNCSRVCCTYDAECACNDDGLQPEFSQDQSLCIAKENPLP
jgi:hypothetical protein